MTTTRPEDLPDFERPPVVETALSVQFDPLPSFRAVHLGLLWSKYRAEYPRAEERSPLEPVTEQFQELPRTRLGLQLQAYENLPVPRVWFLSEPGDALIQVQPDRFVTNWRREGSEPYPRYKRGKATFERDFAIFEEFLRENDLGAARVNQCEVTYVNHIVAGEGWSGFSEADKIFAFWRAMAGQMPGAPEDLRLNVRYLIPGAGGEPVGRLHVEVQPALRAADNKPMYVLHLTARGQIGEGRDFFDLGRRWIVKSFAALTTPAMHVIWGRKDNGGNG